MTNQSSVRSFHVLGSDRFMSHVEVLDSGCWEWVGANGGNGYGKVRIDGVLHLAHRVSYESSFGPIPSGFHIDHLCRNRACVNPDHLEAVTQTENNRRSKPYSRRVVCRNGHPYTAVPRRHGYRCMTCLEANWRRAYAKRIQRRKEKAV